MGMVAVGAMTLVQVPGFWDPEGMPKGPTDPWGLH